MKYIYTLLLACSLFSLSCERLSDECDPSVVCITDRPDSMFVELQLSPPEAGDNVIVRFYQDNVDDEQLLLEFYTTFQEEYVFVDEGQRYSAEAVYIRGQDTITAVDGDVVEADDFYNCEQRCYEWDEDFVFDLRLNE